MLLNNISYKLISDHYNVRTAKRSGVPLINHINEGLIILDALSESQAAKDAFCLHPMVQDDSELAETWQLVTRYVTDPLTIMLAMEYRSVANDYLSAKVNSGQEIRLSPLVAVNNMLIADKVQNRKDFERYHKGTHPRSAELDVYFKQWLARLQVSEEQYQEYCNLIG